MTTVYCGWQSVFRVAQTLDSITGSSLSGTVLDGIKKIKYDYMTGQEAVGQVGERVTYTIVDGRITIKGEIERAYTGSGILGFVRGTTETGLVTSTPNMGIYPGGDVSGQPYFAFSGVKFGKYSNEYTPGGNLVNEKLEFLAIRCWTGSL